MQALGGEGSASRRAGRPALPEAVGRRALGLDGASGQTAETRVVGAVCVFPTRL